MAETTGIAWCDATFNPWIGCTKVGNSPSCEFCYAEHQEVYRFHQRGETKTKWGPSSEGGTRHLTSKQYWRGPIRWNTLCQAAGQRATVFCASLADIGDDDDAIKNEWRQALWRLIRATEDSLDWLLLTKRPHLFKNFLPPDWGKTGYPNVWVGTTVENQRWAKVRIPHLLSIPAPVHFVSAEPLFGPLDLREWLGPDSLNFVISGGESGPNARPSDPMWCEGLRQQCEALSIPFHFKQWGAWAPAKPGVRYPKDAITMVLPSGTTMVRLGKKKAGREINGRTYAEFPAGTDYEKRGPSVMEVEKARKAAVKKAAKAAKAANLSPSVVPATPMPAVGWADDIPHPGPPVADDKALTNSDLEDGGMVPVLAWVRTKASRNAARAKRNRMEAEDQGRRQLTVYVPDAPAARDAFKAVAKALCDGEWEPQIDILQRLAALPASSTKISRVLAILDEPEPPVLDQEGKLEGEKP